MHVSISPQPSITQILSAMSSQLQKYCTIAALHVQAKTMHIRI